MANTLLLRSAFFRFARPSHYVIWRCLQMFCGWGLESLDLALSPWAGWRWYKCFLTSAGKPEILRASRKTRILTPSPPEGWGGLRLLYVRGAQLCWSAVIFQFQPWSGLLI